MASPDSKETACDGGLSWALMPTWRAAHATVPQVSLLSSFMFGTPALHHVQTHNEVPTEVYGVHP